MRRLLRSLTAIPPLLLASMACEARAPLDPGPRPGATPVGSSRPQEKPKRPAATLEDALIPSASDPRVGPLLRAAEAWKQARGPRRKVVDQVYLVPDEDSFFEAVAAWDEQRYFPVLIDDPAWSLPFLHAFRPARVVRFRPPRGGAARKAAPARNERLLRWADALRAVARGWSGDDVPGDRLPTAARFPRHLGATPPGVVLSHGRSPMLAGAVALSAGRFQPLLEFDPTEPGLARPFGHVLSVADARAFARLVERRVGELAGPERRLGDDCDFLTLAGEWPYRYRNDVEAAPLRGDAAVDDLVGRVLDPGDGGLDRARQRWAFTGRLLGGMAASVYRAMCSLFLQPEDTLLWNTYGGGSPWSAYRMTETARLLERRTEGSPRIVLREGGNASLAAWHEVLDPFSRFGWCLVNSSGGPDGFSIRGGTGRPSDLPRGVASVVNIIHSHSAENPLNASTLAGRWLENGAYVYYGAMHEPYLAAFRTPRLVVELAASGMPLVAALRQGEAEPLGRPWRLVYLGDPLYALESPKRPGGTRDERIPPGPPAPLVTARGRLQATAISSGAAPTLPAGDESARLDAGWTAALQALCRGGKADDHAPWQEELLKINRRGLGQRQQDALDELIIDTLLNQGASDRLLALLLAIPAAGAGPRAEAALENLLMARLTGLAAAKSVAPALDLWDAMIRRDWSGKIAFPTHFTERLAALVASGSPGDKEQYLQHLNRARSALSARPAAWRDLIAKELTRLGSSPAPAGR